MTYKDTVDLMLSHANDTDTDIPTELYKQMYIELINELPTKDEKLLLMFKLNSKVNLYFDSKEESGRRKLVELQLWEKDIRPGMVKIFVNTFTREELECLGI